MLLDKYAPLEPDTIYHLYNSANGSEWLFLDDENCRWFLSQYQNYISPIADTFCYCLMRNHIHFLIRIKDPITIGAHLLRLLYIGKQTSFIRRALKNFEDSETLFRQAAKDRKENSKSRIPLTYLPDLSIAELVSHELRKPGTENCSLMNEFVSNQFSNFFNSYAKAYNKMYNRRGSLFMHTFKRKVVSDTPYLLRLVRYIHMNPVAAGMARIPSDWAYSSYNAIAENGKTWLKADEVLEWYDSAENFRYCHATLGDNALQLQR